jgi:hypothetical protein
LEASTASIPRVDREYDGSLCVDTRKEPEHQVQLVSCVVKQLLRFVCHESSCGKLTTDFADASRAKPCH